MLAHPKAASLTKDFMGQWLEIRGLEETPNCSPELLAAMKGETEHFFNHIIREDCSIMDFLNADYTFVNAVLAWISKRKGIWGKLQATIMLLACLGVLWFTFAGNLLRFSSTY